MTQPFIGGKNSINKFEIFSLNSLITNKKRIRTKIRTKMKMITRTITKIKTIVIQANTIKILN
jgi:CRISPR/Cas system CMR-associated protein Cmr3 (group 5 of RAMP superfamily)